MAAHIGVETTYDLTTPTGGYTQEAERERSRDIVTIRDESGTTVVARPKKLITETQSIKGKGDANLAAVTEGAFVAGTVKIVSAKQTENNEDFPDFEIEGTKYENAS